VRIAITSNGPGEFAGWVRPLVSALLRLAPDTEVTLFFVPDDYATGREPELARRLFPQAHVVAPKAYLRYALGGAVAGVPERADLVLYLGGDLMHAARVHGRLGGRARSYKFARKRFAKSFDRVYAVDAKNAAEFASLGFAPGRVQVVGNLAVDGALGEAAGLFASSGDEAQPAPDGILVMPGACARSGRTCRWRLRFRRLRATRSSGAHSSAAPTATFGARAEASCPLGPGSVCNRTAAVHLFRSCATRCATRRRLDSS
jgi:hypothetical protein